MDHGPFTILKFAPIAEYWIWVCMLYMLCTHVLNYSLGYGWRNGFEYAMIYVCSVSSSKAREPTFLICVCRFEFSLALLLGRFCFILNFFFSLEILTSVFFAGLFFDILILICVRACVRLFVPALMRRLKVICDPFGSFFVVVFFSGVVNEACQCIWSCSRIFNTEISTRQAILFFCNLIISVFFRFLWYIYTIGEKCELLLSCFSNILRSGEGFSIGFYEV